MSEPKPIASLSSGLLARKGAARPAMRRQLIGNTNGEIAAASMQDDCGWNDMGYDVNPDPSTPMDYEHDAGFNPLANAVPEVKPEVKQQQDRIAEQLQVQAEKLGVITPTMPAAPVVPIVAPRPVASKAPVVRERAAPGEGHRGRQLNDRPVVAPERVERGQGGSHAGAVFAAQLGAQHDRWRRSDRQAEHVQARSVEVDQLRTRAAVEIDPWPLPQCGSCAGFGAHAQLRFGGRGQAGQARDDMQVQAVC
ncbi:MAG: hypothetical protein KA292_12190 [Sphingorhabdus sp.]|nr:hypothetical protein [Sphingorhabdus sp.]